MRGIAFVCVVFGTSLLATGCFHQVVRTGAAPGTTVIERPWTATYFFGLVPAEVIQTAAQCPSGVAVVETQQSFPNGLVGFLTLGIYTPQTVRITCAAGGSVVGAAHRIEVPSGAGAEAGDAAVRAALDLARSTGTRVAVQVGR